MTRHPDSRSPGRQTLLCGGTAFRRDTHATRFAQNPRDQTWDQSRPRTLIVPVPNGILEPGLVAIARGKTPDPIPNSAVKTLSANGTASQGAEE